MVIINYCAALHVIKTTPITKDPHPVLLNITDNIPASNWTVHTCTCSKLGCLLAHFFCSLMMNFSLGIVLGRLYSVQYKGIFGAPDKGQRLYV